MGGGTPLTSETHNSSALNHRTNTESNVSPSRLTPLTPCALIRSGTSSVQESLLPSSAFPCSPRCSTSSALSAATSPGYCSWVRMPAPISIAFRPAYRFPPGRLPFATKRASGDFPGSTFLLPGDSSWLWKDDIPKGSPSGPRLPTHTEGTFVKTHFSDALPPPARTPFLISFEPSGTPSSHMKNTDPKFGQPTTRVSD